MIQRNGWCVPGAVCGKAKRSGKTLVGPDISFDKLTIFCGDNKEPFRIAETEVIDEPIDDEIVKLLSSISANNAEFTFTGKIKHPWITKWRCRTLGLSFWKKVQFIAEWYATVRTRRILRKAYAMEASNE